MVPKSLLEKAMAPHSSTLAWKIPWTEEPSRLQSMGSRRVRQDRATSLSLFTFMHWRRKWQPTPVFLPGESQGQGTWWASVYGVAQSRTRLKRLSSKSLLAPLYLSNIPSHSASHVELDSLTSIGRGTDHLRKLYSFSTLSRRCRKQWAWGLGKK